VLSTPRMQPLVTLSFWSIGQAAVLCLEIFGCTVIHEDGARPARAVRVTEAPRVEPAPSTPAASPGPMHLRIEDVVPMARAASERVRQAAARVRETEEQADVTLGEVFLPKIDAVGSYWWSDRQLEISTQFGPLRIASQNLGFEMVRATQPLLDVADFFYRYGAERTAVDVARLAAARAADVAELAAVRAFYEILSRREEIVALERSVQVLESHLTDARYLCATGRVPENDVTKVDLELSRRQQALLAARHGEREATLELLAALALPPETALTIEAPAAAPGAVPAPLPQLVARALDERPDLRALAAADHRLELLAAAWTADYVPRVQAFVDYQYDVNNALVDNDAFEGGVQAEVRLFDGLAREHRRAEVRAQREVLASRRSDLERRVAIEVERARLAVEEQQSALVVAERSVAQAEASLRIEDDLYRHDKSAAATVLDSELKLVESRVDAAHARYGRLAAVATLKAATGGGSS
jgi:outer membrane protein TolC